jgi:hypothetical protein
MIVDGKCILAKCNRKLRGEDARIISDSFVQSRIRRELGVNAKIDIEMIKEWRERIRVIRKVKQIKARIKEIKNA